jgi:hypothetical protein
VKEELPKEGMVRAEARADALGDAQRAEDVE